MLLVWSECIAYRPYDQSVSRYVVSNHIVHMVSMSHDMLYQIILPVWIPYIAGVLGCLTICRTNPCCLDGQHVSVYIAHVSDRIPYIAYVSEWIPYIADVSECLTICRTNPCCLDGQHVSVYIARVSEWIPQIAHVSEWIPYIAVLIHAV